MRIVEDDSENNSGNKFKIVYERVIEPSLYGFFFGLGIGCGFYLGSIIYYPKIKILPDIKFSSV